MIEFVVAEEQMEAIRRIRVQESGSTEVVAQANDPYLKA
jgi:hypothetical protein